MSNKYVPIYLSHWLLNIVSKKFKDAIDIFAFLNNTIKFKDACTGMQGG